MEAVVVGMDMMTTVTTMTMDTLNTVSNQDIGLHRDTNIS